MSLDDRLRSTQEQRYVLQYSWVIQIMQQQQRQRVVVFYESSRHFFNAFKKYIRLS